MTLLEYLFEHEIPRRKFAQEMKVSYDYMSKILIGKRKPGPSLRYKIERYTHGRIPSSSWE